MKNHHFQWVFPLKMVIFHSYVKLPEGISLRSGITIEIPQTMTGCPGSSHRHTERQPVMAVSPSWQLARSTSWAKRWVLAWGKQAVSALKHGENGGENTKNSLKHGQKSGKTWGSQWFFRGKNCWTHWKTWDFSSFQCGFQQQTWGFKC